MKRKDEAEGTPWVEALSKAVREKPLVIFRFSEREWDRLRETRRGTTEFTIARSYDALEKVRVLTPCILAGQQYAGARELHFGLLSTKSANTALECRLKVKSALPLKHSTEGDLLRLITNEALRANFRSRLKNKATVVRLSPVLSAHLVARLASRAGNHPAMIAVAKALEAPKRYSSNRALQQDALGLALKAFGISPSESASLVTVESDDTTLAHIPVHEDAVIEHDARWVPGFKLRGSALTGRAVFRRAGEVLEVITANKRPLEEALGVDLIYLNAIKKNVVMLQYKMLESTLSGGGRDWYYRPDNQFSRELDRMRLFAKSHSPGPLEYRLNPQVFYLRFVRRDADLGKSAVTMPLDHFDVLRGDPAFKGQRGAFRISYESLAGRYLRQDGFLDLVSAGYIGAYAKGTADLTAIINAAIRNNRAVIAAVQTVLCRPR